MAKLKVDEIEATSTNSNVNVITKGSTGALEVKGNSANDATLQLNCHLQSHGVKLKAPSNHADLNYTMTLPDNQIAASKGLKVKSVTNNVAQLEYADFPTSDLSSTNFNASNITSGTVPADRMPTLPATTGLGFQLVSTNNITTTGVNSVGFTNLEDDAMYHVVIHNAQCNNTSSINYFMEFLDSSGNAIGNIDGNYIDKYSTGSCCRRANNMNNWSYIPLGISNSYFDDGPTAGHVIFTTGNSQAVTVNGTIRYGHWVIWDTHKQGDTIFIEGYAGFDSNTHATRIHGINVRYGFGDSYVVGGQVSLYKYKEV
tara:strand:+ start:376 stop:1317 length:942 start_codon:yes stop_codon:yes gene_type:complete